MLYEVNTVARSMTDTGRQCDWLSLLANRLFTRSCFYIYLFSAGLQMLCDDDDDDDELRHRNMLQICKYYLFNLRPNW